MITFPNIKINLGLNIISKREDGYHNIESCFYPVSWCDALEITNAKELSFQSSGLPIPGDPAANLVIKAYDALKADFDLPPIKIHLLKSIPMGAGLGGGSADGAFMLKLLNNKYRLGISTERLEAYALQLGSDCPFFVKNQPIIAKGRGELFEPIDLSLEGKFIALINPGLHIGTQEAYAGVNLKKETTELKSILHNTPIKEWKGLVVNDFEESVFKIHPEVKELKMKLYEAGAVYASMSGSGSTVYGIFDQHPNLGMVNNLTARILPLN